MKVIHLISGGDTGGAKTHVLSLLYELNKTIEADLVCFMRGEFSEEAEKLGLPITVYEKNFVESVFLVKKRIQAEHYDLVHCHGARANLIGAIIRNSINIPVISTVHSDYKLDYMNRPGAALTYGNLNSVALRKLDYRVCVSDEMRKILISRGFSPNRLFPIYNGVDFSVSVKKTDRKQYFDEIGCEFPVNSVIVGIAARLDPVKDVSTLVKGFAKARKECPNLRLMIAGDGMEKQKLASMVHELQLDDDVFFAGWVKDMNRFYGALDFNALTSLSETFPYAVTEGARAHLPIVSSAVGGVPMLVKENKTGFLFAPGDTDALASSITKMYSDSEKRIKMGEAIYNKAKAEFSTETTCKTQLEIYNTILDWEERRKEKKRNGVVICGAYGHGNAGDEAILDAILAEIRSIDKNIPITVLSRRPKETQCLHGVDSVYRLNYIQMRKKLKTAKLYINGGGSLIQDVTSRRSLEYYLYTIKTAKDLGCRVQMYGCGIGPVYYEKDIEKASRIINNYVDIITLREPNSLEELKRFGIDKPEIILASDPAMNLPAADDWEVDSFMQKHGMAQESKYICFALRKWAGFQEKAPDFGSAAEYAYKNLGLIPVFLSINHLDDGRASAKVAEYLEDIPYVVIDSPMDSSMVIGLMAKMTVVVSMRLHGLIFAAGQGVPLVGISYDPKVAAFVDYIGQGPSMNLSQVTNDKLIKCIDDAYIRSNDREGRMEAARALRLTENNNIQAAARLLK